MSQITESSGSFSVWEREVSSNNSKNLYFFITCFVVSVLVVISGSISTSLLYSNLNNWSFAILGGSIIVGLIITALGKYKKFNMDSASRQNLVEDYTKTCHHYLKTNNLEELRISLDSIEDLPVAPIFFLKGFLEETQKGYHSDWRLCGAAIISGDITKLNELLSNGQPAKFWEATYKGYNILELAALLTNNVESKQQVDPQVDYGCKIQREILVLFHQSYAKYLKSQNLEERAHLQAQALIRGAELCLEKISLSGLLLNGSKDPRLQDSFALITKAYVPNCPHTLYVTQESLEKIDPFYNANQLMYAEWCHITALAMEAYFPQKSMKSLMQFGSRSRYWLARVCHSESAENYGQCRLKKNGDVSNLCTPINDPNFPRYNPWYKITYTPWVKENKNYVIFAVDVDGQKEEGTSFGILSFIRKGVRGDPYFSWQHGSKINELHQIAEKWLIKILSSKEEDSDQFYHDLGIFYHVLCQYTPFERGSATFSNIVIAALLMHYQIQFQDQVVELPKAVNLLDCYALSMQSEEFVKNVFVPWCKGEIDEKKLSELLN